MKKLFIIVIAWFFLISSAWGDKGFRINPIFDVARKKETTLEKILPELRENRIIIIGEHHDKKSHHMAQLTVIKALKESGEKIAVCLEMFRQESQKKLDLWVQGGISKKEFQKAYYNNWDFPWPLYSMIFTYAREKKIPLVGLNVPRTITQKVARQGFQSLSEEHREKLHNVTCRVGKDYMDFIKKAYGEHVHSDFNFTYFCEAQLVWDKTMAIHALEYAGSHPDTILVLLAGTGHALKRGIPEQIRERSKIPYTVIVPGIKGEIEPGTISTEEADYIMLGVL